MERSPEFHAGLLKGKRVAKTCFIVVPCSCAPTCDGAEKKDCSFAYSHQGISIEALVEII